MKEKLTTRILIEFWDKKNNLKTIGEFKELGRELRDRFNLSDREALDLLNDRNTVAILAEVEERIKDEQRDN